ncbi:putative MFS transporter [Hypoxylon argillaceum]|nr:putative MFS transporter [Hypoxylon argillaceum]
MSGESHDEKIPAPTAAAADLIGPEGQPIDPEVSRRVLRKIDRFLMPAMVIGYGLVYYDKAILGSAALLGMTADLRLAVVDPDTGKTDTSRLSWATSIFYFGQLAGSYPMTYLLQRFNTRAVLGPAVLVWAVLCAATAGVRTWQGLLVQRFFLGFTESIVPTAFMTTVSTFYTQSEQALRQPLWFSGTGWFTIIGGALTYAVAHVPSSSPLRPWQAVYVLAGGLTFLFGLWCFALPASPLDAWFLSPEERAVAVERLRAGHTGVRNRSVKTAQIWEAVWDGKVWLVALIMGSAYTVNGAVTGFGPLIVSTFGYTSLEAILFQFPLGAISALGMTLLGWLCSRRRGLRIPSLVLCCLPVIAGYIIIWKSSWGHRPAAPVVGYSLLGFFGPVVGLAVALGAGNVAGATKKSSTAAAVFVAYCVGNIVGPQLVRSETKAEHYPGLWTGLIVFYVVTILAASVLYIILFRENKRREQLELDEREKDRVAFKDLTDVENPYFRYVL